MVAHLQRQHTEVTEGAGRDGVVAADGGVEEPEGRLELRHGLLKAPLVVVDPSDMVTRDADERVCQAVDRFADRERMVE